MSQPAHSSDRLATRILIGLGIGAVLGIAARWIGATYDPTSHYRASRVFEFFVAHGLTPELLRRVSQHQVARLAERFDALDLPPGWITRDRATPIEKTNARGKVVGDREGDTMIFAFSRKLSDAEALYVAPAPAGGSESSRRFLVPNDSDGGALPAVSDLDLRGGATSGVDLTPLAHARDGTVPGR